jgi:hypothetical protein
MTMTKLAHTRTSLFSTLVIALSCAVALVSTTASVKTCIAGDHYAHFNPYDPRPDFFRLPVYNAWVPYRKLHNRPTYIGGKVASVIEPTSQEAMAWHISKANGDYRNHRPGSIPTYYYPKPWESLQIGARPRQQVGVVQTQFDENQFDEKQFESSLNGLDPGLAPESLDDVN